MGSCFFVYLSACTVHCVVCVIVCKSLDKLTTLRAIVSSSIEKHQRMPLSQPPAVSRQQISPLAHCKVRIMHRSIERLAPHFKVCVQVRYFIHSGFLKACEICLCGPLMYQCINTFKISVDPCGFTNTEYKQDISRYQQNNCMMVFFQQSRIFLFQNSQIWGNFSYGTYIFSPLTLQSRRPCAHDYPRPTPPLGG